MHTRQFAEAIDNSAGFLCQVRLESVKLDLIHISHVPTLFKMVFQIIFVHKPMVINHSEMYETW